MRLASCLFGFALLFVDAEPLARIRTGDTSSVDLNASELYFQLWHGSGFVQLKQIKVRCCLLLTTPTRTRTTPTRTRTHSFAHWHRTTLKGRFQSSLSKIKNTLSLLAVRQVCQLRFRSMIQLPQYPITHFRYRTGAPRPRRGWRRAQRGSLLLGHYRALSRSISPLRTLRLQI